MLTVLPIRRAEAHIYAPRPAFIQPALAASSFAASDIDSRLDAALADTFPASDPVSPGRFD